jgi:hypothetical protein
MHVAYPELELLDPQSFIDRLDEEVEESAAWTKLTNPSEAAGIVAQYIGTKFVGRNLKVIAYEDDTLVHPEEPRTVVFGTIADQWGSACDVKCVSAREINTAFSLFRPLVRRAARAIGVCCQLRYPRDRIARPIAPETRRRLHAFCALANRSCLHPLDWERFFRFIRFCHQRRPSITSGQVRGELRLNGFSDALAERLVDYYVFGRGLLSCSHRWLE